MQFENTIPQNEDESVYYGETVTIDGGGCDIRLYGQTYSASFVDQDLVDVALSVLDEEYKHTAARVANVLRLDAFGIDSLEELGFIYLKASQLARQQEDANVRNEISFA